MSFNSDGFNQVRFNVGVVVGGGIVELTCQTTTVSSVSSGISLDISLEATVACVSSITVLLTHDLFLEEVQVVVTESVIEGSLAVDKIIEGLIGGSASLTVSLDANQGLFSLLELVSNVTDSDLNADKSLVSEVTCTSAVECSLPIDIVLSTVVNCTSDITCAIYTDKPLIIAVAATSSVVSNINNGNLVPTIVDCVSVVECQSHILYLYATYTIPNDYIKITWECT